MYQLRGTVGHGTQLDLLRCTRQRPRQTLHAAQIGRLQAVGLAPVADAHAVEWRIRVVGGGRTVVHADDIAEVDDVVVGHSRIHHLVTRHHGPCVVARHVGHHDVVELPHEVWEVGVSVSGVGRRLGQGDVHKLAGVDEHVEVHVGRVVVEAASVGVPLRLSVGGEEVDVTGQLGRLPRLVQSGGEDHLQGEEAVRQVRVGGVGVEGDRAYRAGRGSGRGGRSRCGNGGRG